MRSLARQSFEFDRGIESPLAFVRHERKSILVFGGGFCLVMAAMVLWIDPSLFYPRLQTDALLYYLKAKSLVETGSTSASVAINVPPIAYTTMSGVLIRAPFILAFREFDEQCRAMQLPNIPILASVADMCAYIFSWVLSRRHHWEPLEVDHFFCGVFILAFLLRFTGPVLFVFAGTDAGRRSPIAFTISLTRRSHQSVHARKSICWWKCGTLEACQAFPEWKSRMLDRLCL